MSRSKRYLKKVSNAPHSHLFAVAIEEIKTLQPFEEEEDLKIGPVKPQWMWPTNERFNTYYKYFMLVHASFVAIFWVFRISFERKPDFIVVILEFYMDFIFAIDIFRVFTTPFQNEVGKLVMDRKMIATRYLKSWLLFDLYCCVPLALLRYRSNRADGGYDE